MKFIRQIIFGCLLLFPTGCGVSYLGKVGQTKFYAVANSRFTGPNINALVSETNGNAKVEGIFSGPGVLTAVGSTAITAGTPLGAAYIEAEKKGGTNNINVSSK